MRWSHKCEACDRKFDNRWALAGHKKFHVRAMRKLQGSVDVKAPPMKVIAELNGAEVPSSDAVLKYLDLEREIVLARLDDLDMAIRVVKNKLPEALRL